MAILCDFRTYSRIKILMRSMSLFVRCKAMLAYSTLLNFGTEFTTSINGDSGLSSNARGWSRSSLLTEELWFAASPFVDKTGVSDVGVTALFVVTFVAKSLVSTLQKRCVAPVNQWSATPGFPPLGMTFGVTSSLFSGCCVREFIWSKK